MAFKVLKIQTLTPANPITPPALLVTLQDTTTNAITQEQVTLTAAEYADPSLWLPEICALETGIEGCPP